MTDATAGAGLVERALDPAVDYPAMVELIRTVNAEDGVPWFPTVAQLEVDWSRTPRFEPTEDVLLVDERGRLVAAAQHEWRERSGRIVHALEVWVRPDARRRGLGRRALAWAEARARASVAAGSGGPPELPHVLSLSGPTSIEAPTAFAAACGYTPVRYTFVMRRDLSEPIEDVPLPPGIELRPVTSAQHRQIWDADTEAFLDHWEAGVRGEADYARFFANPDLDTGLWQVAWDGDEVAGAVMNGIYADENVQLGLEIGWMDHVSVRRPWRRRGLASALISRSLHLLRERGMELAQLGVDAENPTGALGIYERSGFRVHQRYATFRKPL